MHTKIRNWSARRSGAGVTIKGDCQGVARDGKVSVVLIEERQSGKVVATDREGNEFELVTGARLLDRIDEVLGGDGDPCVKLADIRMLVDAAR